MINQFKGQYAFLSNFYPSGVWYDNQLWGTAEHLYQSFKTLKISEMQLIFNAGGPADAKRMGKQITLREDWALVKDACMATTILCKFSQSPPLRDALLETYPHVLIEGNTWHDQYWGECYCNKCSDGVGSNKL